MNKAELRKNLGAARHNLSSNERSKLSRRIIDLAFEIIDWSKINSVHSYLPIAANNEVDTLPLLMAARQQNPDIKIASTDGKLETHWLDADFKPAEKVRDGFRFGLIIAPMLAFDKSGYRLGYGGGFYDRFLAGQDQALTIGLCYELGSLARLPRDDHDIPLHIIVTEKTIYKF